MVIRNSWIIKRRAGVPVKTPSQRKSPTLRSRLHNRRLTSVTNPYKIMKLKSYKYCSVDSVLDTANCAEILSASPSIGGGPFMPPSDPGSPNSGGDFHTRMAMVPEPAEGTAIERKNGL